MSIRYACVECGSVFKIKESLAGTKGKCPTCKVTFVVPDKGADSGLGLEDLVDSQIRSGPLPFTEEKSPSGISKAGDPPATSRSAVRKSSVGTPTTGEPAGSEAQSAAPDTVVPDTAPPEAAKSKPVKPEPVPSEPVETPAPSELESSPNGETPAEDEFDVDSFLMDENAPGKAATAGLSTAPPPKDPGKPQYDKQGRRLLSSALASPATGTASAAASAAAEAVDAALEGGQVKAAPIVMAPRRRWFRFSPREFLRQVRKNFVSIVAIGLAIAGTYWLSSRLLAVQPDLPVLSVVSGTVTVDDKPLADVVVHLTPVFAQEGKSVRGQPIRLRDSIGITDESGRYSVEYLDGIAGAPMGNVRIWVETIRPEHLKKIPPSYLSNATPDIRAVKEAGNETRFDLKLKSP